MTPTTVSAILQLDFDDRLPYGPPDARTPIRLNWIFGHPMQRCWVLRLMLA